jgi:hypothetical protein
VTCTTPPQSDAARNSAKTKGSSSSFVLGTLSGFVCRDSHFRRIRPR